jgi:hypothetical protein
MASADLLLSDDEDVAPPAIAPALSLDDDAVADEPAEVERQEPDPRLRTPEGRADVALSEAIELAEIKLSLPEMIYAMDLEMVLVEGEQRARLLGGTIELPVAEQVERIARFACVIKFLKMCHERPQDTADHFAKVARKRTTQ